MQRNDQRAGLGEMVILPRIRTGRWILLDAVPAHVLPKHLVEPRAVNGRVTTHLEPSDRRLRGNRRAALVSLRAR